MEPSGSEPTRKITRPDISSLLKAPLLGHIATQSGEETEKYYVVNHSGKRALVYLLDEENFRLYGILGCYDPNTNILAVDRNRGIILNGAPYTLDELPTQLDSAITPGKRVVARLMDKDGNYVSPGSTQESLILDTGLVQEVNLQEIGNGKPS